MSPAKVTRTALRRELRRLSREFADQLYETLEEHGVFEALAQQGKPTVPTDGASAGPHVRIRRSDEDLEAICRQVLRILRAVRAPVAISTIAAQLGTRPRDIAHPIALLVARGEITKTGERRGTRYAVRRRRAKRTKSTSAAKRRGAARRR
ncbi:MAG: hypothetical protein JRI23_00085 [Deltaproteobacteria bacterium]|jgi:hypothetical protein|nr:hypothetical protein [Deltaproteobacteria bacterium]MBW2529841.1 hypothetical protein [Deltaproteobacteria bacterium]